MYKTVEHPATDTEFVIPSTPFGLDTGRKSLESSNPLGGDRPCAHLPFITPGDTIEDADLRRLLALYRLSHFHDATPCLFAMAGSIQNRLEAAARRNLKAYRQLLEQLCEMADALERRTKGPYALSIDGAPRQALPPDTLKIWPFTNRDQWVNDLAALRAGRAEMGAPKAREPLGPPVDLAKGQAKVDQAMLNLESQVQAIALSGPWLDRVPLVKSALGELAAVTPKKVAAQTGVKVDRRFEDDSVLSHLQLLLYHGPYTVLLDVNGSPTRFGGAVDGAMLIGEHGDPVWRQIQAPGLSFSLYRRGFGDFRVAKGKISKILFGGIGGLVHRRADVRVHDYQLAIQRELDRSASSASYVAALVSPSAFNNKPLTIERIVDAFPRLESTVLPYVVAEVMRRLKDSYEHWDKVVVEIGREILINVIQERVKSKVINYLEKTVFKSVVPLINAAFAVKDAIDGGPDRRRVRLMIHCILFHTQGDGQGDTHIASSILAELVVEQLKQELIQAVTERLAKNHKVVERKVLVIDGVEVPSAHRVESGMTLAPPTDHPVHITPPFDVPVHPPHVDPAAPVPYTGPPSQIHEPPVGPAVHDPATAGRGDGAPATGGAQAGEAGPLNRKIHDRANKARLAASEKPAHSEGGAPSVKTAANSDTTKTEPGVKPMNKGDGEEGGFSQKVRDEAKTADPHKKPEESKPHAAGDAPDSASEKSAGDRPKKDAHEGPMAAKPDGGGGQGEPFKPVVRDQATKADPHEKPSSGKSEDAGKGQKPAGPADPRKAADNDPRRTRSNGLPPPPPRGKTEHYDNLIQHPDDPALKPLQDQGYSFEPGPVRAQGVAREFQVAVGGEVEWTITGPDGTKYNADYLAVGTDGKLILGDAKWTGADKHDGSAHVAHWPGKVEALERASTLAMMSDDKIKVELTTATPPRAPDSRVASDAYDNMAGNVADKMVSGFAPDSGASPAAAQAREEVRGRLEERVREVVDVVVIDGWMPPSWRKD